MNLGGNNGNNKESLGKRLRTSVAQIRDADTQRVNIIVRNNMSTPQPAMTQVTFGQSMITDGTDRYLAVQRLAFSGSTIPIFFFQRNLYEVRVGSTSLAGSLTVPVDISIPGDEDLFPPGLYTGNYPIYSYNTFLMIVNRALSAAWNSLNGKTSTEPPRIVFDPSDGLVKLVVEDTFLDTDDGYVQVNQELWNFFPNFAASYPTGATDLYAQFLIQNEEINTVTNSTPTTFIVMSQEFPFPAAWFDIQTVQIQSNLLKLNQELVPSITTGTVQQMNNSGTGTANGGGPVYSPILTDFQPLYDSQDRAGMRGWISYVADELRPIDVLGDDIRDVDITVNLVDKRGRVYPYYIPIGQSLQLKLVFQKKTLWKHN